MYPSIPSDELDEYDLGGSIVYCCQIVLDLMCYGPPYIIWGIHIPFLTYGVDTVSEVFWEPERSLCGIALFHEFSFNVVNILYELKDRSTADRECDWNVPVVIYKDGVGIYPLTERFYPLTDPSRIS